MKISIADEWEKVRLAVDSTTDTKLLNKPSEPFPLNFPSFKRIPDTEFVVDGFRNAGPWSNVYFLTHFHSDHYQGIVPGWKEGLIFCSAITAKLISLTFEVEPSMVKVLPMNTSVLIDNCEVIFVEANHCPGAIQILFAVPSKQGLKKYVHCGDMRYHSGMKDNPHLKRFLNPDAVYLDTTYCNPKFTFPSQKVSVEFVADMILAEMSKWGDDNAFKAEKSAFPVIFLISTYVIGKENILNAVAEKCKCKIHVDARKLSILSCLELENMAAFTTDERKTPVRVVGWKQLGDTWPYFRPNFSNMEKVLEESGASRLVGFVPTGWTWQFKSGESFPSRKKGPPLV